jgi:transglutaminase-like putative cysteine protease
MCANLCRAALLLLSAAVLAPDSGAVEDKVALPRPKKRKERTFDFTYEATVTGLKEGQKARVWLPVPRTTGDQEVKVGPLPAGGKITEEPRYGNRMLYLEAVADKQGRVKVAMTYRVKRREVRGVAGADPADTPARRKRFLLPDALVPIDGKPLDLIKGKALPAEAEAKGKTFYDVVNAHMKYSKVGTGWGRGDSVWACDSKHGNCSDFHSLFISLARSQNVLARFEIGFPLPEKRGSGEIGGYHCWAFFYVEGRGWVPVDISEANKAPALTDYFFGNLTEDRVAFSNGRDVDLVPRQAGKPLNFFVYPHVEVDGKEYPQAKIVRRFTFRDVK